MDSKQKKNYRKAKRKKEKKYMRQGRLPEDYDSLEQDKKDELYYEI
jgi:hypothetical protein